MPPETNISQVSPFSLQDFQQLVSSAFEFNSELSIAPPPSHSESSPCLVQPPESRAPSALSFRDTASPSRLSPHPLANVYSGPLNNPSSSRLTSEKSQRSFTPLSFIKSIRSRASAIIRSPNTSDQSSFQSQSTTPTPSVPSTARPSVSSRRALTPRPQHQQFDPLQIDIPSVSQTAPSRSASPFHFSPTDLKRALARDRSHSLPRSFLDISHKDGQSPPPLPSPDTLQSFFDDSAYTSKSHSNPLVPAVAAFPTVQFHTRLPPLRKSKSFAPSLFKKHARKQPFSPPLPASGWSFSADRSSTAEPRCPSPYTNPRDPPSPPTAAHLTVPQYILDRRGSTTSTCTTSSAKSTSSLSDRISQVITLPFSKSGSKSKLHLSIGSSNSTPSSTTSGSRCSPLTPASSVFPPGCEPRPRSIYPNGSNVSRVSFAETQEEALAIGRVLTPDEDPFAKADINVSVEETPRIAECPVEWNKDFTFSPQEGFLPASGGVSPHDIECICGIISPLETDGQSTPTINSQIVPLPCPVHHSATSFKPFAVEEYTAHSASYTSLTSTDWSTPPSPVPASAFPLPPPLPVLQQVRPLRFSKPLPSLPSDILEGPLVSQTSLSRKPQRASLPTPPRSPQNQAERRLSTRPPFPPNSITGVTRGRPQSPFPLLNPQTRGFSNMRRAAITEGPERPEIMISSLTAPVTHDMLPLALGHNDEPSKDTPLGPAFEEESRPLEATGLESRLGEWRLEASCGIQSKLLRPSTTDSNSTTNSTYSDAHTSRSTAFFSARSSVISFSSSLSASPPTAVSADV